MEPSLELLEINKQKIGNLQKYHVLLKKTPNKDTYKFLNQ